MSDSHSKFSASGFEAAMLCPGKRVLERGKSDGSSKYANEGTAAHALLEWCIRTDSPAKSFPFDSSVAVVDGVEWFATPEMVEAVQTTVDNIKEIVGPDGMLLPEQRVNYAKYLGVADDEAWGTSDIIGARDAELQVHDYKHGMGVEVDAEHNPQMMLYGLGALAACQGILGDFDTVRLVIHQPRIKSAPSEWMISVADLEAWGKGEARRSAGEQLGAERMFSSDEAITEKQWQEIYLRPNEKSCRFCKAKATCPALHDEVTQTVSNASAATPDEFDDLVAPLNAVTADKAPDWIAAALGKVDLIEDWCKAVRAEAERRLLAGEQVSGFKVVQGKQGNRQWSDAAAAEKMLREQFRLKVEQAYDLKLISPTSAEKLAKAGDIGPRQWKAAEALITRAAGKPHVAPLSDPRPALVLTAAADEFSDVSADPAHDFA